MRDFVCGFTDAEAKFIRSNAVCSVATVAAETHDAYVDTGTPRDLDAFMEALGRWREAETYPFPSHSRTFH